MTPRKPCLFTTIKAELVYKSPCLEHPPHEASAATFLHRTPPFRINLLASDGDILYYAYSSSHLARYRIYRSNGIILKALPAIRITPASTVNNIRVADFDPSHGGRLLLMAGGSELTGNNGTLSVLQLPTGGCNPSHQSEDIDTSSVVYTFSLPVLSAWGLGIHREKGLIAVSSNSRSVILLTAIASRQFVFDSDESDENYGDHGALQPADQAGVQSAVQIRLVPIADALRGTHLNNIPGVAFSHNGQLIATASVDTTFAISEIRPSEQPTVIVGLNQFIQHQTGRRLVQLGRRVHSRDDARRSTERAWIVHWIPHSFVCYLGRAAGVPDTPSIEQARNRWTSQRSLSSWAPNPGSPIKSPNIFQPYHYPIEHTGHAFLYDDRVDEDPSDAQYSEKLESTKGSKRHVERMDLRDPSIDSSDETKAPIMTDFVPEGWTASQMSSSDGKSLLLVCYEKIIELYEVNDSLSQLSDQDLLSEGDVKLLDSVHYGGANSHRQMMFTNVVEIPALRALLVTGIGSGVLLIRIVSGIDEDQFDNVGRRGDQTSRISLYVEEIFSTDADIAGVCVVEREGDSNQTRSFETWILQINGHIECWDLSSNQSVVNHSCII